MSEKRNNLVLLPDEFYPTETSHLNVISLNERMRSNNCRKFADYYFGEDKPLLFISNEELKVLFEKIEKENRHLENEDGDIITLEKLLEINNTSKKCVLFLVPNEPTIA